MGRPPLPRELRRDVLVEAGHRCAIPTCRSHPVEVAHIEPRKKDGSNDVFHNLIALCANCHTRHHTGEIDRKSLRQYKANLSVLNSRYGDLERRVLLAFAANPFEKVIQLPGGLKVLLQYLLEDGLVRELSPAEAGAAGTLEIMGMAAIEYFGITAAGRKFITQWLQAGDLEQT